MVGILTFHKAINYGAVLQAHALRTAVESLDRSCSVLHYAGEKMEKESRALYFPRHTSLVDRLLYIYRLPMRTATVRKFNRFLKEHLHLSHTKVIGQSGLESLSDDYHALIAGSDQVFNYTGTGEDFHYYLEFARQGVKRIAYAPSFGLTEIDEAHRERVKAALERFDALSVREETGANLVEDLLGQRPVQVCDPTFLLKKEQWEQLCISPKRKKPYVLVYSFGSRHLEKVARELAAPIGAQVVNINRSLPLCFDGKGIRNAYAPGPREFLGLIREAEMVVTNSFHGMALSILLEKEFYTFTNHYANSAATNNRFDTLANRLGLTDRIYRADAAVERHPVDYQAVSKAVDAWRREGYDFLSQALRDEN